MYTTPKILTTTVTVTIITLTLTLPTPISPPSHPRPSSQTIIPLTPAPSSAALALLTPTTLIRGATAPIRCYERITTLASAHDFNCKRKGARRECSEGSLVLTMG